MLSVMQSGLTCLLCEAVKMAEKREVIQTNLQKLNVDNSSEKVNLREILHE